MVSSVNPMESPCFMAKDDHSSKHQEHEAGIDPDLPKIAMGT